MKKVTNKIGKIIFDNKSIPFILEALGMKIKNGFVEQPGAEFGKRRVKVNKIIAIRKNKETGEPILYTDEGKLIGDMLHDKYGIFM